MSVPHTRIHVHTYVSQRHVYVSQRRVYTSLRARSGPEGMEEVARRRNQIVPHRRAPLSPPWKDYFAFLFKLYPTGGPLVLAGLCLGPGLGLGLNKPRMAQG